MMNEFDKEHEDILNKILLRWHGEETLDWGVAKLHSQASFDIGYLFGTIALLREALKED